MKTLQEMVGKQFKFYGVNCNCFKLDKLVWEAIENENDGYRSALDSVELNHDDLVFPRRMLARVVLEEQGNNYSNGWQLTDVKDSHIWLRFGTDNTDDYYPLFVFDYQPKAV